MNIEAKYVKAFFSMMNQSGIQYVLLKNVDGELPSKLKNGKDIDILVHPDDRIRFEHLMRDHSYDRQIHPLGAQNGWTFGYLLSEYLFFRKRDIDFDLYIDAGFRLCCKSFMPKIWIPLDESIANDVWREKIYDERNGWWMLDDRTSLIYYLVRAIFDKHEFTQGYIREIQARVALLDDAIVKAKLEKVFFKYTPYLIERVREEAYPSIMEDYVTFVQY